MTKRLFALIIAVLMIATVFAACGDKNEDNKTTTTATTATTTAVVTTPQIETDALTGSWSVTEEGLEIIYTFNGDGTGVVEMLGMAMEMTYEIDDNKVTYTLTVAGQSESQTLDFTVNGNELTLTDGIETLVFTKKEGHVPADPSDFTLGVDATDPTVTEAEFVALGGDIVGSWSVEEEGVEITYTFNADGTGSIEMMDIVAEMTYTTDGATVTYITTYEGESESQTLEYAVIGNELTMTDGEYPITFTKK